MAQASHANRARRGNDDDNQYKGLIHRLLHLVDRSADKLGIVKTVVVMNIFGKVFLHLLHAVIYGVGYFNVVAPGCGITTTPTMGTPFIFI